MVHRTNPEQCVKRFQICQSHCKAWDASAMLSEEGESTLATHLQSSLCWHTIRKLPDSWILRTEFNVPSCVFLKNQPFYIMYIIALDPVQTYNLPRQHWGMSCEGIRLNHAIRQCRCNVKVLGFHFMHLFARYACCFLVGFIVSYEATSMRHCNWLMSINTGS